MKIILIHPNNRLRTGLRRWLEKHTNHAVLLDTSKVSNLAKEIACYEPDLVFLPAPEADKPAIASFDQSGKYFPNLLFVLLPKTKDAMHSIPQLVAHAENLLRELPPIPIREPEEGKLIVFADPALKCKNSEEPSSNGFTDEENHNIQTIRYIQQLQVALSDERHAKAKRYLALLRRDYRRIRNLVTSGICSRASQIALLRDQIGRWMTVLAHYIPGIELEHCPKAQPISTAIRYIHHRMPATYHYPVASILMNQIEQDIWGHILQVVVPNEAEPDPAGLELRLLGINEYLAQVTEAQIFAFEQFLDLNSEFHTTDHLSLRTRQRLATYFRFWCLDLIWADEISLPVMVKEVLNGALILPNTPVVAPSFRKFLEMIASYGENRRSF